MERTLELFRGHAEQPQSFRQRRALVSAIGKASRFLFGTLDEDDKEVIKRLISHAETRTSKLAKLLVNHMEIAYKEFGEMSKKALEIDKSIFALKNQHTQEIRKEAVINAVQILEEQVL